ncbi:MAG: hypothetical protein WD535_03815, partial [Thermaerobacterales bacterium]
MQRAVIFTGDDKTGDLERLGPILASGKNGAVPPGTELLIHWGQENGGSRVPWNARVCLNRPEAQELSGNRRISKMLWRRAGLTVRGRLPQAGFYRVCLVDLKPVGVYRAVRSRRRRRRAGPGVRFRRTRRQGLAMQEVILAAQRALHVLRLDFGVVDAGLDSKKKPYV